MRNIVALLLAVLIVVCCVVCAGCGDKFPQKYSGTVTLTAKNISKHIALKYDTFLVSQTSVKIRLTYTLQPKSKCTVADDVRITLEVSVRISNQRYGGECRVYSERVDVQYSAGEHTLFVSFDNLSVSPTSVVAGISVKIVDASGSVCYD